MSDGNKYIESKKLGGQEWKSGSRICPVIRPGEEEEGGRERERERERNRVLACIIRRNIMGTEIRFSNI